MKRTKRSLALAVLTSLSLGLTMVNSTVMTNIASAAPKNGSHDHNARKSNKVGPDLRDQMAHGGQSLVKVILQLNDKMSGQLNALLRGNGVKVKKQFVNFNSFSVDLPANLVDVLSNFPEVSFISIDSEVRSLGGHIAHTSGADNVRSMSSDGALDGNGVGIAIVDSGIYAAHTSFSDTQTGNSRIVVSQDFTGEGRTDDPFGHGTHVAAAAAGNGIVSQGEYIGIAPRANLINLRVLNSQGIGSVSTLFSALDWLMANGATYNVRVVNLSLGMPAVNSFKNDPLCIAVRHLVDRGIVVVAAAGDNGPKTSGWKHFCTSSTTRYWSLC